MGSGLAKHFSVKVTEGELNDPYTLRSRVAKVVYSQSFLFGLSSASRQPVSNWPYQRSGVPSEIRALMLRTKGDRCFRSEAELLLSL